MTLSTEGAGDSVTELVCEIRWDRLGKVSEAELFNRGQWLPNGEGEVGVISPGARGVRGLEGVKQLVSLSNICRMLWITSPAPEHRSARSFLERRHKALPGQSSLLLSRTHNAFRSYHSFEIFPCRSFQDQIPFHNIGETVQPHLCPKSLGHSEDLLGEKICNVAARITQGGFVSDVIDVSQKYFSVKLDNSYLAAPT